MEGKGKTKRRGEIVQCSESDTSHLEALELIKRFQESMTFDSVTDHCRNVVTQRQLPKQLTSVVQRTELRCGHTITGRNYARHSHTMGVEAARTCLPARLYALSHVKLQFRCAASVVNSILAAYSGCHRYPLGANGVV